MSDRLDPAREADLREQFAGWPAHTTIPSLLAELAAVRKERDEAKEPGADLRVESGAGHDRLRLGPRLPGARGGGPMTRPINQLDVDLHALMANLAADTLHAAAARSSSPSDRIAYALDEWLIRHPEAPVSTDATYPGWTPTATKEKAS